jgi:DNA ligase-1
VVLLAELAETSRQVRATASRSTKIGLLADLLIRLAPEEIVPAVSMLAGNVRQGRIGVGWATVRDIDVEPASAPELTLLDFDAALDELVDRTGPGSVLGRRERLRALFTIATEAEAELMRRVMLGDLGQGALEGLMADAIARAASVPAASVRRAAMLTGDLAVVAAIAFTDGRAGLDAVGLHVLRAVSPMLASPAADVSEAIAGCGLASVEWKLDGIRIQVHRAGTEVRVFTRSLNEISERLGRVVDLVGSLPITSIILDGEVIGDDGEPRSWFFDCLHLDGEDLIDAPLDQRMAALERVVGQWRIPATMTDDPDIAAAVLDAALAAGHEGVVIKAITSRYEAGRRGKSWRKVKPVRTVDLVVLGAEWGSGRRRGWLSNLHLGARDARTGEFLMVGKTFKGLTDELLTWQTERLQKLAVETDGFTVFVRPELVVEIALDGVQESTRYPGGVGLRFARVRRYRTDKSPSDADTTDALRAMLTP